MSRPPNKLGCRHFVGLSERCAVADSDIDILMQNDASRTSKAAGCLIDHNVCAAKQADDQLLEIAEDQG